MEAPGNNETQLRLPVGAEAFGPEEVKFPEPGAELAAASEDYSGRVRGVLERRVSAGRAVVDLHPEPSRRKIAWLLQEAAAGDTPVPVTMTINTPDRPLLLSISRLESSDGAGEAAAGFCLLLYDYRGLTALPQAVAEEGRLAKLPVLLQGGTALVDPAEVVHQGEGEAASLQDIREILSPFQLVRHKVEGPLGIPISQHIPGVPEGFGEGASAFQEGGQGGAETDQKEAPVETGSVKQTVAHFPALF